MKKMYKITFLIIIAMFVSCDDIFEEDITDGIITILYPTEGVNVVSNIVSFQWVDMTGAKSYRVQIINDIHSLVIDTLVIDNSLYLPLIPAGYTWRVRGENDAYESLYNFPVAFEVEVAEDLTSSFVILDNPSDNMYTNSTDITYSWLPLSGAENYDLELVKSLGGNTLVHQETVSIGTSITLPSVLYTEDAEYIWKIKGVNSSSETIFSRRSFFLDRINPNQPILNSPVADASGSNPIVFNWSFGSDTGTIQSPISSEFQIATDNSFTNIIYTNDNAGESIQYNFNSLGDYFWRVKSLDTAGNESEFSDSRKITVM